MNANSFRGASTARHRPDTRGFATLLTRSKKEVRPEVLQGGASQLRHRRVEFAPQDVDDGGCTAFRAERGGCIEESTAQQDEIGTGGQRLGDVFAAAYAAVQQDGTVGSDRLANCRQRLDGGIAGPAEHLVAPSLPTGEPGTKIVVKELARRSFDAAFVYRRKSAFNLPLAQYFRSGPFVALMEDRLLPGMASRGLVDVSVVRRWWRRGLSAPSTTEGFWIPVALELWAQQFIDGRGRPQ